MLAFFPLAADTTGMSTTNDHDRERSLARRLERLNSYKATVEEREALLAAAERAKRRERALDDVRPIDPITDAVAGVCFLLLCGGFAVCVIGAVARWIWGVL